MLVLLFVLSIKYKENILVSEGKKVLNLKLNKVILTVQEFLNENGLTDETKED